MLLQLLRCLPQAFMPLLPWTIMGLTLTRLPTWQRTVVVVRTIATVKTAVKEQIAAKARTIAKVKTAVRARIIAKAKTAVKVPISATRKIALTHNRSRELMS
ncbi:hypothetical protein [Legionella sainthelensi]|nr:hypothetical protein [Legionella sainthelensi]